VQPCLDRKWRNPPSKLHRWKEFQSERVVGRRSLLRRVGKGERQKVGGTGGEKETWRAGQYTANRFCVASQANSFTSSHLQILSRKFSER